jgi:hypothetical protein
MVKMTQDLIHKERLTIIHSNKHVLTSINYTSNPAPGLTHKHRVYNSPALDHFVKRSVGDERMTLDHWWNDTGMQTKCPENDLSQSLSVHCKCHMD